MNIKQVSESARLHCCFLDNKQCVTVTIAAAPAVDISCQVKSLEKWAEQDDANRRVIVSGSWGYYDLEPVVLVEKPTYSSVLYGHVTIDVVSELIRDCIEGDNIRADLAFCNLGREEIENVPSTSDLPLFTLQKRIALRNCGLVDPEDVNHYVAAYGGYTGLAKALEMSQAEIFEQLRDSNLVEGCTGDLVADRWKIIHDVQQDQKYVVCSAVDNDPRTRTANLLLWGDPHSTLEGMLIAAYAVGASRCIIAVETSNNGVVERLRKALRQMIDYGLLGETILGSEFSCDIEIKEVVPSLVLGEETALMSLLEGGQAIPRLRNRGGTTLFRDKPALVDNAEILANVSAIFQRGAEWFSAVGTASSKGSKVITLSGTVVHGYTVEIPFGTTLGDIVYNAGGGIPDSGSVKAVQVGGPTGVYFSVRDLSRDLGFDCFAMADSIAGLGSIQVIADGTCAVEVMDNAMLYTQAQSCGKCVFCREGTLQISQILNDVVRGEGEVGDPDLLVELAEAMKVSSLCNLGKGAARALLSSIELFRHEYDVHTREKRCPLKS
jgi:NADH-quinone oxidoreductase subunit F